ncbi:MAG: hypothetical protein ACD_58C00168G0002 [uncultured bacterium]|nr:MAG: hypothetical protein ACD_58C00168G0002 [uncultured bacterium]
MQLNVPLIRQKKNSVDCGLAAVAMVLNFYGVKINIEKLREEIKVYKMGTYMPQLGQYLIKKSFKVTMTTLNPYLFTFKDKNLIQKEIVQRLKNILKKERKLENIRSLKFSLKFIKAGGKIELKIPNADDVKNEIDNKRPLITILTPNIFESDKPEFNLHFNVVTGYKDNFVYANDSLWNHRGGKKKYLMSDFLYSVYSSAYSCCDNASLLKINK